MRKLLVIALFLILVPGMVMAKPKLNMPETHWDFGSVPQNSVLSHDYWIRNSGDDTLKIFDVKPG